MISCVILLFSIWFSTVSGSLVVLRGNVTTRTNSNSERKLLCVSEDDGRALVWNSNLIWNNNNYTFSDRSGNMKFRSLPANTPNKIDCALNSHENCLSSWDTIGWAFTNSEAKPMGPVFDRRWEAFTEYNNFHVYDEYRLRNRLKKSGAIVFSIRGNNDAHILLCDTESYESDFCYWIIIGGWNNEKSTIQKCAKGVPHPTEFPLDNDECSISQVSSLYQPLSATEWKTFIFTWNETTKNISLYDTEKIIMSYVDPQKQRKSPKENLYLFLRSPEPILLRFHTYSFFHTIDPKAVLTTDFYPKNGCVCIQLIIGLCKECQMKIKLIREVDKDYNEKVWYEDIIYGSTVAAAHGLPMWQSVKINQTIQAYPHSTLKIKFYSILEKEIQNPLWAVADFRECPTEGTVRYGIIEATQDYSNNYYWPNVTCQKFFYNESVVVNSVLNATPNLEFEDLNCPEGKVGPYCSIDCNTNSKVLGGTCKGTVICEESGCTCTRGFQGVDCSKTCEIGRYGHHCKKTCGSCKNDHCNSETGICMLGCDNSKKYHIPPFCKIFIDKPPPPKIDFLNETTIWMSIPVKEEYKIIPMEYQFHQQIVDQPYKTLDLFKDISNDTTMLVGYIDNLQPGTIISIALLLAEINSDVRIHGEWKNVTTHCASSNEFHVKINKTSLTLTKSQQQDGLYPCPDAWYDVIFQKIDAGGEEIMKGSLPKFPYKFSQLVPFTLYKITIGNGNTTLFSREVKTLEAAPSLVESFQKILTSPTEVTFEWEPPKYPNGIIQKYNVTLQVVMFLGCYNTKVPMPKTNIIWKSTTTTTVKFDLHLYAVYIANVSAYTSYRGPEKTIKFETSTSETPTSVYSNLTFQDYTLTWGPPKDCTKISGPILAKIVINGVNEAVKDFHYENVTNTYSIDLAKKLDYGREKYRARVYTIRSYHDAQNDSIYVEQIFTTPPKSPPSVKNLEIFEVDTLTNTTYLRWQKPEPPINGEIQHYVVKTCYKKCQSSLKVLPTQACTIWKNYICAEVNPELTDQPMMMYFFQVSAVNVNVSMPGKESYVTLNHDIAQRVPDAPENLTVDTLDKGIVNVTWSHPWRTGGRIEKFQINVDLLSSNLKTTIKESLENITHEYYVTNYKSQYNQELYLLSSSCYEVSIRAITNDYKYGKKKSCRIETPLAMKFNNELNTMMYNSDSTIFLQIPEVLNDTKNSITSVLVKGPRHCEGYSEVPSNFTELAGIEYSETAWRAATFPTEKFAGKTFVVGDKTHYDGAINCQLKPEGSYVIMVIVQTEEESTKDQIIVAKTTSIEIGNITRKHFTTWLIPIALFLLFGITAIYFYRKKKKGLMIEIILQEEMALTHKTEDSQFKTVLINAKQILPTPSPSDKESLSRTTTPEVPTFPIEINQKREKKTYLVKVKDFGDYVRQSITSGLLDEQYYMFPRGQTKSWEYGKLPENKLKNRYINLIAYDDTRVALKKLVDDPYSDYINANYITGYNKEKFYIATQGPKTNTVTDFWRMIWQEDTRIICMLANLIEGGKIKCEQYWPDIGKKKKYGDVIVLNAKHNVFADYTFRTLYITYEDETRKIEHLHYTAWPDHGVPLYTNSVVAYLKKLLATPSGMGPVVVHCSAGVGRTGTIILCDICLRRAAAEGVVDVFAEIARMRCQRANMVDNKQQYLLTHLALVECLLSFPTTLPCNEVLPLRIKELKNQLTFQQQRLQDTAWQDEALRPTSAQITLSKRNLAKNRFPELVSDKTSRVYLKRYPQTDDDSDYISAVYVDGVQLQNQFLATQLPLPSTFNDFWRMIAEFKVELIVMLQPSNPGDPTCCSIVPTSGEFKPTPYINIISKEIIEFEFYKSQKLLLIDNSEKPAREQQVTILLSTEWKPGRNQDPPPVLTLVTLWQAAERIPRGDGPTVVLCHDGVTGCGLYLALSFLLERMSVEKECDVCLAIRAVRRFRPDFVQALEHLEFLYDAAIAYLEHFETYANFT